MQDQLKRVYTTPLETLASGYQMAASHLLTTCLEGVADPSLTNIRALHQANDALVTMNIPGAMETAISANLLRYGGNSLFSVNRLRLHDVDSQRTRVGRSVLQSVALTGVKVDEELVLAAAKAISYPSSRLRGLLNATAEAAKTGGIEELSHPTDPGQRMRAEINVLKTKERLTGLNWLDKIKLARRQAQLTALDWDHPLLGKL